MTWTHETVVHPAAWSARVEHDLAVQALAAGYITDLGGLDDSFATVRGLLNGASGPQRVVLRPDDVQVIPVEVEPDDVREARHAAEAEARIAAQRDQTRSEMSAEHRVKIATDQILSGETS